MPLLSLDLHLFSLLFFYLNDAFIFLFSAVAAAAFYDFFLSFALLT